MIEFIYIPIILLLYYRTYRYRYLIDDPVPRDGYMYVATNSSVSQEEKNEKKKFYENVRVPMATITNIGVFIITCSYIHYLWGWKAALLFAVFPLNVSGVAWVTGNYYMTTALLVLATHLLIGLQTPIFAFLATFFYAAALNSTLNSLTYVFYAVLYPYGYLQVIPFLFFYFGKRMQTGLSKRKDLNKAHNIEDAGKIKPKNLLNVPKVIAYYVAISFWPSRLGFFHEYGKTRSYFTTKRLLITSILCVVFTIWGCSIDKGMTFWWLLCIGLFSQFITLGQFTSERYTIVANIAFCVLVSKYLQNNDIVFTIVATLWFYRSHLYIPIYKNNESLFSGSITAFPRAPENYNNLASLYLDYGKYDKAINPLLLCLQYMEGNHFGIYCNLANCYASMGLFYQAYNHTLEAIKWCPKDKLHSMNNQKIALLDKMKAIDRKKEVLKREGII